MAGKTREERTGWGREKRDGEVGSTRNGRWNVKERQRIKKREETKDRRWRRDSERCEKLYFGRREWKKKLVERDAKEGEIEGQDCSLPPPSSIFLIWGVRFDVVECWPFSPSPPPPPPPSPFVSPPFLPLSLPHPSVYHPSQSLWYGLGFDVVMCWRFSRMVSITIKRFTPWYGKKKELHLRMQGRS